MAAKPTWTLLLIDAQPMSRSTLKRQLEYYGYAVLESAGGRDGVRLFQEKGRQIDLAIVDAGLADAPAARVIEVLKKLDPRLAIALITDQAVATGREPIEGVAGVLKRPVRTDRLLAVVARALGRQT